MSIQCEWQKNEGKWQKYESKWQIARVNSFAKMNPEDLFVNHWASDESISDSKIDDKQRNEKDKPSSFVQQSELGDMFGNISVQDRLPENNHFESPILNSDTRFNNYQSHSSSFMENTAQSRHSLVIDPLGNPFDEPVIQPETEKVRKSQYEDLNAYSSPLSTVSLTLDTRPSFGPVKSSSVMEVAYTDPLQNPQDQNELGNQQVEEKVSGKRKRLSTKYEFNVVVGDAIKAGDFVSTYTEYNINTTTNDPKYRSSTLSVMRRYSDFLWLFNQLCNLYIGVIIPPIPEKMSFGRFQDEFVEKRKIELDLFLKRIVVHPILQLDESLMAFLESENFNPLKKSLTVPFILGSELLPMVTKPFPEVGDSDPVLTEFKREFVILEAQIKSMESTCISILETRKEYEGAIQGLASSFQALGQSKLLSEVVSIKLKKIAAIQNGLIPYLNHLREFEKTNWLVTIGEYIRIIGSIKIQFQIRQKCYASLQDCELVLQKKQLALEKVRSSSQIRQDKIQEYTADIEQV